MKNLTNSPIRLIQLKSCCGAMAPLACLLGATLACLLASPVRAQLCGEGCYRRIPTMAPFRWEHNTQRQQQHGIRLSALADNDTGDDNTASGAFALNSNTTGDFNTAAGL